MFPTKSAAPEAPDIAACPTSPILAAFPTTGALSRKNLPAALAPFTIPSVCWPAQVVFTLDKFSTTSKSLEEIPFKIDSALFFAFAKSFALSAPCNIFWASLALSNTFLTMSASLPVLPVNFPTFWAWLVTFLAFSALLTNLATSAAESTVFPTPLAVLTALPAVPNHFAAFAPPRPIPAKAVNPKLPKRFIVSLRSHPSWAPSIASSTVLVAPPATPKIGTADAILAIVETFFNPEAFLHALDTSCTVIDFPEDGVTVVFSEGCLEPLVLPPLSAIAAKDVPDWAFKTPPCLKLSRYADFGSSGSTRSRYNICNFLANSSALLKLFGSFFK